MGKSMKKSGTMAPSADTKHIPKKFKAGKNNVKHKIQHSNKNTEVDSVAPRRKKKNRNSSDGNEYKKKNNMDQKADSSRKKKRENYANEIERKKNGIVSFFYDVNGTGQPNQRNGNLKNKNKTGEVDGKNSSKKNKNNKKKNENTPNSITNRVIENSFGAGLASSKRMSSSSTCVPWMTMKKLDSVEVSCGSQSDLTLSQHSSQSNKKISRSKQAKKKSIVLPTASISTDIMTLLNNELYEFSQYVKLNETECSVRDHVIVQLNVVVRDLFTNNLQPDSGGKLLPHNQVQFQLFGSYATKEVCTFTSDIDLALWGVCGTPCISSAHSNASKSSKRQLENNNQNTSSSSLPSHKKLKFETLDPVEDRRSVEPTKPSRNSIDKKRERLLEWKKALADSDDTNIIKNETEPDSNSGSNPKTYLGVATAASVIGSEKDQTIVMKKEACESRNSEYRCHQSQEDNSRTETDEADYAHLFTIDRIGVNVKVEENVTSDLQVKKEIVCSSDTEKGKKGDETLPSNSCDTSIPIERLRGGGSSDVDEYSSDEDEADKMATFVAGHVSTKIEGYSFKSLYNTPSDKKPIQLNNRTSKSRNSKRKRRLSAISLTASSGSETEFDEFTDSDEDFDSDDYDQDENDTSDQNVKIDADLEVSFTSDRNRRIETPVGSRGFTNFTFEQSFTSDRKRREVVVDALCKLSRKLRQCKQLSKSVQLIKFAKVPIIKMVTCFGFEADIAIAGHNGADTSLYAAQQVEKYKSFSTVVLFLKILLHQHDLDAPFTGGLGSYKLYVLLAIHLEKHLELGGVDEPAEILLTFLYRYGGGYKKKRKGIDVIDSVLLTELKQDVTVRSSRNEDIEGSGTADLSNVFRIDTIVNLFRMCFQRLMGKLNEGGKARKDENLEAQASVLCEIINVTRLKMERKQCIDRVMESKRKLDSTKQRTHIREFPLSPASNQKNTNPTNSCRKEIIKGDLSADQLVAGYNMRNDDLYCNEVLQRA